MVGQSVDKKVKDCTDCKIAMHWIPPGRRRGGWPRDTWSNRVVRDVLEGKNSVVVSNRSRCRPH